MCIHTAQQTIETLRTGTTPEEVEQAFNEAFKNLNESKEQDVLSILFEGITGFTENPLTPASVIETFWGSTLTDLIYEDWDISAAVISALPQCPERIREEISSYPSALVAA